MFGPLNLTWRKSLMGAVNQALIVDGRLVVNVSVGSTNSQVYGSRVIAYDLLGGRLLWERPTPGRFFSAPIAAGSGRIVSVSHDGVVRAFSSATGEPLWERKPGPENGSADAAPVVGTDRVFVSVEDEIYALALSDGDLLWANRPDIGLGGDAMPVLDRSRLYVSDSCGNAAALSQVDGVEDWRRDATAGSCFGAPTMVAGGRVFADGRDGHVYSAATGADSPPSYGPGVPDAVDGGLAFRGGEITSAWSLADAKLVWSFDGRGRGAAAEALPPVVAGETVYTMGPGAWLYGLDRASGRVRMSAAPPKATPPTPSYSAFSETRTGIAVAQGVLAVTRGNTIDVYRPVLSPPARGVDAAVSTLDVLYGQKMVSVAGVGSELRGVRRPVTLLLDRFPYGRFRRAADGLTLGDGTTYFRARRVTRNTRLRVRLGQSGAVSRPLTIYAYPRSAFTPKPRRRGGILVRVKLRAGRDFRVGGRRLVLYLERGNSYRRLGAARLRQTGRGRAVARVVIRRPPRARSGDFIAYCVPGLARRGFGPNDAFERRCGRRRFRL